MANRLKDGAKPKYCSKPFKMASKIKMAAIRQTISKNDFFSYCIDINEQNHLCYNYFNFKNFEI